MKLTKKNVLCLPKIKKWKAGFFCDLRKDFVLDQRILRRDLLRVESRVKSLLSFDTRSVELQDKFDWIFTLVCFICPLSEQKNCLHLFKFCESELFQPVYQEGVV